MVILERSVCSVDPTVILSMLKFLALKRLVTLNKTPGLFSTKDDSIYKGLSFSLVVIEVVADIVSDHAPVIISFRPVPGATNGYTSSSGSIGISITVATSVFRAALIALSNSSNDCTLIPSAP